MTLQLLELPQAERLSACKFSLSLGITSAQNVLEQFLRFSGQLMQTRAALLTFYQEPYHWYHDAETLAALDPAQINQSLNTLFMHDDVIDCQHPQYSMLLTFLHSLPCQAHSAIALQLRHPDQTPLGYVILWDEHAREFSALQQQLLQAQGQNFMQRLELQLNYDELKELYEQEEALNFSKTKFFSIISHDLRAPFHGLLGFSEILAKERNSLDEAGIQDIADYLYDTSQSTYNLLESLLHWAMAEGGRFVYHPIYFKLRHVTTIVTDILKVLALKKNIQLINEVDENLTVYADINMITSVMQNLVSNALKFTDIDGSGKVYIQAQSQGATVEICVKDTGLGMTSTQLNALFQPRMQMSHKGTAGEKGAGLGLALCQRLVEINLGHIHVTSHKGQGTSFTVTLPATREAVDLTTDSHKTTVKFA